MASQLKSKSAHSTVYQIRIRGHLDSEWSDWLGGMSITLLEGGETLLTGPVIDQAALYGLLRKVRDMGLTLVSVCPIESALRTEGINAIQNNP